MIRNFIHKFNSPAYQLVGETARKNWLLILLNLATNILSAGLEGITLGVIYLAVNNLTGNGQQQPATEQLSWLPFLKAMPPTQIFVVLIIVALALQTCLSLSNYCNQVSASLLSAKAQPYVTGKVFSRIMSFSYSCVSRYKVGDLVFFANDAALAVDRQITSANAVALGLSFSAMYLLIIVQLSVVLAGIAFMLTVIVALAQYKILPRLRKVVKEVTSTRVISAKYITESIQALRLLHTFGTQARTAKTAEKLLDKTQIQLQKRAYLLYLSAPILEIIPILALATLAIFAVLIEGNQATILPMLITFLLALQRLSVRLKGTATAATQFVDNSASMQRLNDILSSQNKEFERSGYLHFSSLTSDISFQNVSLSYSNDDQLALKNISFEIPRNQVTALVGESGAGKSSIVDLLLGIYTPTAGKILINSQNLQDYKLIEWRREIGVVSQDTFVFNASIEDNLRYGSPQAERSEVMKAAKLAHAHQFITALPDGYNTVVGERGYRLSGGQRQRLALARALVKQPEILILDEATSALDSESEKLIQQALQEFQRDRTVVVIAHRLSTIASADQILVLEKGSLVERGTHSDLLERGERYARYWQLQSRAVAA